MSFVLHLAAMFALTLTFVVSARPGTPTPIILTTLNELEPPEEFVPAELVLEPASGDEAPATTAAELASQASTDANVEPTIAALKPGGEAGKGVSAGPQPASGSFLDLPENAVQAGSFAAWWIPKAERYGEKVEPGQPPREGQDYRIYVQVLVPKGESRYKVDDLSGEIVGTDGYKQVIPQQAWMIDDRGELIPAVGGNRYLPVRNGVAEIVFKVKGAGRAGVRDLVFIRSRLLDEERTLTLEFQTVAGVN
jgi:hypothetical protein